MIKKSILIVDTYYPAFLRSVNYDQNLKKSYSTLKEHLMSLSFGTSDAYSCGLKKLGWDATEVIPNCFALQNAWGQEYSYRIWKSLDQVPPSYIARIPILRQTWSKMPTLHKMLRRQITNLNPAVVYFQDLNFASPGLLTELRREGRLVVGQIASPLPPVSRLKNFDLILSSLPNQIEQISSHGVKSEFLPIAFDKRILDRIDVKPERDIGISFVGGISKFHNTTVPLLQAVQNTVPELEIFGYGAEHLLDSPSLYARHRGERWGKDMYDVLFRSRATLNRHISISEEYANNMRLFEATGAGTLLITDQKSNLAEYFKIGEEVLAYSNNDEAADLAKWAEDNRDKAAQIATKGQERTMREHTYDSCMEKLDAILVRHL
jgi:spore maturation protein CgeB